MPAFGTLRTRADRLASCPGLREQRTKASDLPSCARRRPTTEVYLFNMAPLKRTYKADLNIPGEILARF